MKKIFRQCLAVFFISTALFAQSAAQKNEPIFETGYVNMEELAAYLDYLTIQLGNNPNSKSLIKIYGGHERFFAFPYTYGAIIKAFLKNNRQLPAERFTVQFCNINKEPFRMRFFILEENDKGEPCEENLSVPEKTVLFQTLGFYGDAEFSSKKPFEETIVYTVEPSEQEYFQTTQNALLRLLNEAPESKIYLVGYLGTSLYRTRKNKEIRKSDKPKALNKIFRDIEKEFVRSGINASRIVKVYGGYQDSTKNVEIWFVPKDGAIPQPKPDYFPKK